MIRYVLVVFDMLFGLSWTIMGDIWEEIEGDACFELLRDPNATPKDDRPKCPDGLRG